MSRELLEELLIKEVERGREEINAIRFDRQIEMQHLRRIWRAIFPKAFESGWDGETAARRVEQITKGIELPEWPPAEGYAVG